MVAEEFCNHGVFRHLCWLFHLRLSPPHPQRHCLLPASSHSPMLACPVQMLHSFTPHIAGSFSWNPTPLPSICFLKCCNRLLLRLCGWIGSSDCIHIEQDCVGLVNLGGYNVATLEMVCNGWIQMIEVLRTVNFFLLMVLDLRCEPKIRQARWVLNG